MIRQDLDTTVKDVTLTVVIIPFETLQKMMGYWKSDDESLDQMEPFIETVVTNGGTLVDMDLEMAPQNINVIKKFTVNNEGKNQIILEMRPDNLTQARFLKKDEPTSSEYFNKRFKEMGNPWSKLKGVYEEIMQEYKEVVKS